MDKHYYIELLNRYRENRLSKEELIDLFDWINSAEGISEYDQYLNDRMDSADEHSDVAFDRKRMFREIKGKMDKPNTPIRKWTGFRKYAAILALCILTGTTLWLVRNAPENDTVFATETGEKGSINLSDGSTVWLNAGSKITYNSENQRRIQLEGEAFLHITKDEKHQFLVQTSFLDITVFGTSFNVSAYPVDSIITVSLVEGVVGIGMPGDKKSITRLHPGQVARFDVRTGRMDIRYEDLDHVAIWRNEELRLTDTDIYGLVAKLEAWYGIKVRLLNQPINPSLYNITIRDESVGEILELINNITPIAYTIQNREIIMEYTSEQNDH